MEQPAARLRPERMGLVLAASQFGRKADGLYRLRERNGQSNLFGNFITPDGRSVEIAAADNSIVPTAFTDIESRKVPTAWRVVIPAHGLRIETIPLNARSWMGTSFAYWEGPISFTGSHSGAGYLELTGY